MATATPDRRRARLSQSHAPSTARSVRGQRSGNTPLSSEIPALPEYEVPEAPLTVDSQRKLAALLQTQSLRHLKTHLQHAAEKLTDSAGEINDRLSDARVRYERNKEAQRRRNDEEEENQDGDDNEDNDQENSEEYSRLAETETKVNNVTDRLEEKMRQIVDSEVRLQGLTDAMTDLEKEESAAQAAALGPRRTRRRPPRRGMEDGEEEEGPDDDDGEDEDYQGTPEREAHERNAQNPPSRKLDVQLEDGVTKWNSLSLTERYASHNAYIGFYRIVHDSKFPGDEVPPLPHSSTWFAHMEDAHIHAAGSGSAASPSSRGQGQRRTRTQNRSASPANSDDIAIERERISLKCPLTLLPYHDPVTSTKCPHSFERAAITDMISRSPMTLPSSSSGRGARRVRAVKCPICSILLCEADLRSDAVLLRRVRRAQELSEREAEDEQLEGSSDGGGGRRRRADRASGVLLTSDAVEGGDGDDSDVDMDLDGESHHRRPPNQSRVKAEPLHIKHERAMSMDGEDDDEDGEGSSSAEAE